MKDRISGLLGELALLHVHAENAEHQIERFMARIERAHRDLALEQAQCLRAGDQQGYERAVAEEAALNAAYQRLQTAIGRMHFGGKEHDEHSR